MSESDKIKAYLFTTFPGLTLVQAIILHNQKMYEDKTYRKSKKSYKA